ncbi:MAG: hypothetical protein MMC23_006073 [Stictis urceolatum]|nr:hypothetical protein [Stictis urceolata]
MVKYATTALVAMLASAATAEHHGFGRRHLHPRHYSVAPVPVYSTVPEASSSASVYVPSSTSVNTVPEASNSASSSAPYNSVPVPSGPATVPSAGTSSAPYGMGNTTIVGPTSTGDVIYSTVSVIPLESTPAAGVSSVPSNGGGNGGNGGGGQYSTGGAPGVSASPSLPAGSGGTGGECGPETVTVTAPGITVTVTAGGQTSDVVPSAGPSSVPAGESESAASSYAASSPSSGNQATTPAESASIPAVSSPAPVETPSTPAAYSPKPETTPAAGGSSTPAASAESSAPAVPVESSAPAPSAVSSYAATSAASTSAAPSSSSYPVSGAKRGVVYTDGSDLSAFESQSDKCGWSWNWNGSPDVKTSLNYVPILNNAQQADTFSSQAKSAISAAPEGSKYVMGPNEPDQSGGGGSGMTVSDAVDYYSKYITPMKAMGAQLGSISVTSDQTPGSGKGLEYLEAWKKECDSRGEGTCPVDFVCVHWYGPDKSLNVPGDEQGDDFITYMKGDVIPKVNELFGAGTKIWVTEFGASPDLSEDTQATVAKPFLQKVLPYLDGESQVDRYAYFMASTGYMIDASGNLTPGGEAYLSA